MTDVPARARIIKAADFTGYDQAAALLAEAGALRAAAEREVAELRETARREGLAEGRAEGLRAGLARIATMAERAERDLLDLEPRIRAVVLDAVEMIVGAIPPDERTLRLIRRALDEAGGIERLTIEVPAEAAEELRAAARDLPRPIEIGVDPLLAAGELVLRSEAGRMHIGLREQMAALAEGMADD